MDKSREIVKKYWGFDRFRPMQEEIVDAVIYGHDTLALLPTGGGKSLCFQVPGIAREGITLVISPLIALMQDQVANLQSKGIRAKSIISGMSHREMDITLDNARFGGLDFLYTSPERIQSKLFMERFKGMNVGLIVVDEAHCISEWGHDFRPAFKEIYKLREIHPDVPIIALTATATDKVRADILKQLQLKSPKIFEASFERSNLSYETQESENKLVAIVNYCKSHDDLCGIVYCQTRKSVKDVARILQANRISVGVYHGGMTKEDRERMLKDWLTDKIKVMVSTNAFGMGIDKPDVRFVLHYEFPPTLEAYFQEAGRAGRDGKESRAIVFWEKQDLTTLQERIKQQFPEISTIKTTYRAVCNFLKIAIGSGKDESYPFEIAKLCSAFQLNPLQAYNSLKILEMNNDLVFSEGVFHPTKVKYAIGNKELYNFQIQHSKFLGLTTLLSRSYAGIFEQYFEIHEKEFCTRLAINTMELENQLKQLEKYGVLDISWKSSLPTVTLTHERLPDDYLSISAEVYTYRKQNAEQKLEKALQFIELPICRSVQLLKYFGQESEPCGKCDVCKNNSKTTYRTKELKEILLPFLQNMQTIEDCIEKTNASSEQIKNALKELILEEKIEAFDGKFKVR
jgi:ATP-dependent DNA helicase RecQ